MSNDIYSYIKENFGIEITDYQFKRDYIKEPLRKLYINTPTGYTFEKPFKEDLEYLYITLNLSRPEVSNILLCSDASIGRFVKFFSIKKSAELKKQIGIKTNLKKYGTKNPLQNKDIRQKVYKTNLERYGKEHYAQTELFKKNFEQYSMEKYGVKNPSQLKEIRDKVDNTNLKKYGVKNVMYIGMSEEKIETLKNKDKFKKLILENNYKHTYELAKYFNITEATINQYINKYHLRNLFDYSQSKGELEVRNFINEYYKTVNNSREIVKPYELDIYIPEKNIAIEYNGEYWHSQERRSMNDKIKQYLCREKNIELIVVWEKDWYSRKEEIKNMLLEKLNIDKIIK